MLIMSKIAYSNITQLSNCLSPQLNLALFQQE